MVYNVFSVLRGNDLNCLKFAYRIITGKSSTQLYYIVVLIQLILITPMLIKYIQKQRWGERLLWALTPIYLMYLYGFNIAAGKEPLLYSTLFPAWFIFYYLGLQLKLRSDKIENLAQSIGKPWVVILMLALSIVEGFGIFRLGLSIEFACSQIKVSSFLFSFSFALYLCNLNKGYTQTKTNSIRKVMKFAGDYSYGVFYIHCIIILILNKVISYTPIQSVWVINWLVVWILTAILSFAAVWIGNRLLSNHPKLIQCLGLK